MKEGNHHQQASKKPLAKALLRHKFLRARGVISRALSRMRSRLLRDERRNLDTSKSFLGIKFLVIAPGRTGRCQVIQIVVVVFGITAADDGCLDVGVCAGKNTASSSRGSSSPAARPVATGGEDVGEKLGEHGSCAGETGADDGDVAFDSGPFGGADVVV